MHSVASHQPSLDDQFYSDHLVYDIALRQHGVISAAQLIDVGITRSGIHRRVAQKRLHRVHRATYALGHNVLSPRARIMAAVLAVGGDACVTGYAAAYVWGIVRAMPRTVSILTTRQVRAQFSAVQITRTGYLPQSDSALLNNIPVTSIARTMLDLAAHLHPHGLANIMHEAAFHNLLSHEDITAMAQRRYATSRATQTLVQAMALNANGSTGTRSRLESLFLHQITQAGLPQPGVNVSVPYLGHRGQPVGTFEVDFLWRLHHLIVEIDGPGHSRSRSQRDDAARTALLRNTGFIVYRCADVHGIPACIRTIQKHLGI